MVTRDIYRDIASSLMHMCYGSQVQDSMLDSDPHIRHIALVGITGVGKSTLVNVLKGDRVAEENGDVRPCTTRAMRYELVEGGIKYYIWDTRGLSEASEGAAIRLLKLCRILPDAERELKRLLRCGNPRFNLVLLCIDAKKIRVGVHWKIYNLIFTEFCKRRLKVAVVPTQLGETEFRDPDAKWKTTCQSAAKGVAEKFPDGKLMEAVPKFEGLDDLIVKECKHRLLTLITDACS